MTKTELLNALKFVKDDADLFASIDHVALKDMYELFEVDSVILRLDPPHTERCELRLTRIYAEGGETKWLNN